MSLEQALAELQSKVGSELHVGDWLTVTQERINQFAEATGDHQWIHVDPERAAAESPYQTTIAHGYLTLSMLPYLREANNPDKPRFSGVRMGVNYGLNRVRFPHPVKVGARIRTRTTLLAFEEVRGGVQIVRQVTVEIEGESKPGCVAETVSRYYF